MTRPIRLREASDSPAQHPCQAPTEFAAAGARVARTGGHRSATLAARPAPQRLPTDDPPSDPFGWPAVPADPIPAPLHPVPPGAASPGPMSPRSIPPGPASPNPAPHEPPSTDPPTGVEPEPEP